MERSEKGGSTSKTIGQFKFQRPSSRAGKEKALYSHSLLSIRSRLNFLRPGSRATSIKVEPGSALESNASASIQDKLLSPSYVPGDGSGARLAPARRSKLLNADVGSSDSSSELYSLLKSSDEFLNSTNSSTENDKVRIV